MGDEQLQNIEQQEQEQGVLEDTAKTEEVGNVVKVLRRKLEDEIRKRKELEKKLEEAKAVGNIANIEEITEKLKKIDRLEFENQIIKKYPQLVDEVDKVWEIKKPDESIEDAVARYIGKKQLETLSSQLTGYSVGSSKISPNLQEPDITQLPPEERKKLAQELFKQVYGKE